MWFRGLETLAKLRLEIGDPVVGGSEFARPIAQVSFDNREAMAGVVK
jgi:hypothetical protein